MQLIGGSPESRHGDKYLKLAAEGKALLTPRLIREPSSKDISIGGSLQLSELLSLVGEVSMLIFLGFRTMGELTRC